ncbi:helix-turn-helix domain-containing protein [Nocardia sp.]|uniref:helix-turn-helix domain-containing protein n=1 Tax=Nocardia sp. TaxID=1821 RepID=UPI002613D3AA|nr:helix-turn-helix domain-containing protein [Nocardia sp.]
MRPGTGQHPIWLSTNEVAQRLRVPPKTLAVWASARRGPRFARIGRYRRYRLCDVIAWEQQQLDSRSDSESDKKRR